MPNSVKNKLSQATLKLLKPLVRILLKNGVSHAEFSELGRKAYVDVAFEDFQIKGRKQTVSRVSVLTGLSRKEVLRLSQQSEESLIAENAALNRAVRVINGWLRDTEFQTSSDTPLPLPLHGETSSFSSLVKRYSGDITAGAVLDELLRVGAVKKQGDLIELCSSGYVPMQGKEEKVGILGICATDLLNTLDHNLEHDGDQSRFQRAVAYHNLPDDIAKEFETLSKDKTCELLVELNAWLSKKKANTLPLAPNESKRIGLGIYYFESEPEKEHNNERS